MVFLIVTKEDCFFRIRKDKIGEISIKLHYSNDEAWTVACHYMLSNLQSLQKWISTH